MGNHSGWISVTNTCRYFVIDVVGSGIVGMNVWRGEEVGVGSVGGD